MTGPVAVETMPHGAAGSYYLIACADDRAAVKELTDTDNCFTGLQTIVVQAADAKRRRAVDLASVATDAAAVAPGGSVAVRLGVDAAAAGGGRSAGVTYFLGPTPSATGELTKLGEAPVATTQGRSELRQTVRVPADVRGRRQFLVACQGSTPRPDACVVSRKPLFVTGAAA